MPHSLCLTQSLHFEARWHTKKHVSLYVTLTLNTHRNTQTNASVRSTACTLLLLLIQFFCLTVKCTRNLHSYFAERLHYAMKVTILAAASFTMSHPDRMPEAQPRGSEPLLSELWGPFVLISHMSERFAFSEGKPGKGSHSSRRDI